MGRVVDEDVERPGRRDFVGDRRHLCRVAKVDAHDGESITPVVIVVHQGESSRRVSGKTRRDGESGTRAKKHQRDVHTDLRASTGEKRPLSAQVHFRVPFCPVQGGAPRA